MNRPSGREEKPLISAATEHKVFPELPVAASYSSCPSRGAAAALGECCALGMEVWRKGFPGVTTPLLRRRGSGAAPRLVALARDEGRSGAAGNPRFAQSLFPPAHPSPGGWDLTAVFYRDGNGFGRSCPWELTSQSSPDLKEEPWAVPPEKSVWTLGVGTLCVGDPRWRAGDAPAGPGTEQRLRHRAGSGHVPTLGQVPSVLRGSRCSWDRDPRDTWPFSC